MGSLTRREMLRATAMGDEYHGPLRSAAPPPRRTDHAAQRAPSARSYRGAGPLVISRLHPSGSTGNFAYLEVTRRF